MSMTTLGAVGLGAGAVAAAGAGAVVAYFVFEPIAKGLFIFAVSGHNGFFDKDILKQNPRLLPLLAGIAIIGAAIFCCSCGYISFLLAKAVWLKAGAPSLLVPLGIAAGSAIVTGLSILTADRWLKSVGA